MKTITKVITELKHALILSAIGIVFLDFILLKYNEFIVTPILNKAVSNILVDIIFISISIYIFYTFFNKVRKDYFVKNSQFVFCLIVIIFYIFFRIKNKDAFLSFYNVPILKYFDIIFLYFIVPVLLKLSSFFKKNNKVADNLTKILYSDTYIKSSKQDTLNRRDKAKRVFKEIQELKSEDASFSIGVVGEWGSGKTSFLSMIKEQFKIGNNKDYIVIDFNPWLNISLNSILQDFFNTLEENLKEYSFDISKSIKKYSNSVLSIHKNSFTESILKGVNLLFDSSLTEEFKNLNNLLKKLNKRIIIVIDDFDRLQANEIFEILKLIRNTAGFDTFTYVVAYDKTYLIESLKSYKIPNPEKFSEKIFLREIELLPVTKHQVNNTLKEGLLTHLPNKKEEIDDFFDGLRRRFHAVTYNENNFSFKTYKRCKTLLKLIYQ